MNQEQLDAHRARTFAGMNSALDFVYKGIILDPQLDLPKLPEHIFTSYFLPYFAGQVQVDKHVADWISVAGAPSQQVNIIDNAGNVLFTVPALLNTAHIQRLRPEGSLPFVSIIAMANALGTQSPARAEELFINTMLERYRQVHNSDYKPTDIEMRWIEIFTRYNVTPVFPEGHVGTSVEVAPEDDSIDQDDFKIG